jgi:hypothetical protein
VWWWWRRRRKWRRKWWMIHTAGVTQAKDPPLSIEEIALQYPAEGRSRIKKRTVEKETNRRRTRNT